MTGNFSEIFFKRRRRLKLFLRLSASVVLWLLSVPAVSRMPSAGAAVDENLLAAPGGGERLYSGIETAYSSALNRDQVAQIRSWLVEADNIILRAFGFRRDCASGRLRLEFDPRDPDEYEYLNSDGKRVLRFSGDFERWCGQAAVRRELLRAMTAAQSGRAPTGSEDIGDWVLSGLDAELNLPWMEDSIWRVGYYPGIQGALINGGKADWARLCLIRGLPESRLESECCRLLLFMAANMDRKRKNLMRDYLDIMLEKRADPETAFWSTAGFDISQGGNRRASGAAALNERAARIVFSPLSPVPARETVRMFEEAGRIGVNGYDPARDDMQVKLSGTWESWPEWCAVYDMETAAETASGRLKDIQSRSALLIGPGLEAMRKLLDRVAGGGTLSAGEWAGAVAAARDAMRRQEAIEDILYRLEEQNPRLNERMRIRLEAVHNAEEFPFPSGMEDFIKRAENELKGTRENRR